jgi:hypothetical protein
MGTGKRTLEKLRGSSHVHHGCVIQKQSSVIFGVGSIVKSFQYTSYLNQLSSGPAEVTFNQGIVINLSALMRKT